MNRFDRITAILIQLQSKRIVTAQEIADRFDISLRTVYRDIRSLEEAGVPILSEAGVGYSMMDGYRLPPVVFTKEEALTFVTAEKLMDRYTDYSTNKDYQSALFKVKAVLKTDEKESIEKIDERVAVVPDRFLPEYNKTPLSLILTAIEGCNVLSMEYFANHSLEHSTRMVEPVGVFHMGQFWHLIAYCKMRKDYRDFRLDRIKSIVQTEIKFDADHPSLNSFLEKIRREQRLIEVVINIRRDKYRFIGDQKYYNGFISQVIHDEKVEMRFLTESLEGFARWYLMIGDIAEITTPQVLKDRVRELAQGLLDKVEL